jgi:hypothetical protein
LRQTTTPGAKKVKDVQKKIGSVCSNERTNVKGFAVLNDVRKAEDFGDTKNSAPS